MSPRVHNAALTLALVALLWVASSAQRALNRERVQLDLTRGEALGEAAPPVLVFTTVALGGFRGLIANALWVRAIELQEQDKYFEKVQLADWITKLQPRIPAVWINQAWDMAYNISIKFTDPNDRWLWVQRGIELLRDQALRYNPDDSSIYHELAWIFQHKLGADLDDAHLTYKTAWAEQMIAVLGTNYVDLISPTSDDARSRAKTLREQYKMDPAVMREIDDEYGPLDWRLPEAHAVYWATMGFKKARKKDVVALRRTIFQPMQLAFQRGRLIINDTPQGRRYRFAPNLQMLPRANEAYLKMAAEDEQYRDNILRAHRNFLKDAVYFLYTANRRADAERWYTYLLRQYPDAQFQDARSEDRGLLPLAGLSVDDYAVARVTEDIGETSNVRLTGNILGLLVTHFFFLATDADDEAVGHERLARIAYERFQRKIAAARQQQRVALPPYDEMKLEALRQFEQDYPDLAPQVRTRLNLPTPQASAAEPSVAPPATTNAPAAAR